MSCILTKLATLLKSRKKVLFKKPNMNSFESLKFIKIEILALDLDKTDIMTISKRIFGVL